MRLARWLLGRVLHPTDREPALCDLDEEYEARMLRDGAGAAARWYRVQVRRSLWPALQRRFIRSASRPSLLTELRWAWRGLRARRLAGAMHMTLVALAVGASGIVFAAADAFVFRPAPYPNADRLVVFQRMSPVGLIDSLMEQEYRTISARSDLFSRLYLHTLGPSPLIAIAGTVETVRTWDVEPGLFEALGVAPGWGRSFVPGDELPGREPIVILRADLARGLFGSPAAAVDQIIDTGTARMRVVGVMPLDFRFPTSLDRIWRPLARRPGDGPSGGMVAVLAAGVQVEAVASMVEPLLVGGGPIGSARVVLLQKAQKDPRAFTNIGAFTASDAPRLFSTLLGAMLCLSAIIWLNIAGLSLASALGRARVRSLQTVLGATRATLVRTSFFEVALPTAAGTVAGFGLAIWGTSVLAATLPPALGAILTNPIDLDVRAAAFMAAVAVAGAIVMSIPDLWWVSRLDLADRLRTTGSGVTMSRTHMTTRYALMAGQLTLSVLLLSLGALLLRSYLARLDEDKGFDSRGLATIEVRQRPGSPQSAADLEREILSRLTTSPPVVSVARTRRLPPDFRGGSVSDLWIQDRPSPVGQVAIANFSVDPEYFRTMGIRLLAGRLPAAADPAEQVVVDSAFASRFWPTGDVLGARFWTGRAATPRTTVYEIIGVVSRVQLDTAEVPQGGAVYVVHSPIPRDVSTLTMVARLIAPERLGEVNTVIRAATANDLIRTRLMDDRYAEVYGDTRIAAALTGGFAVMAFLVAMVGVYGVTSVLVAARTREIGIRIALGANRDRIRRLVVMPTVRLLIVGIVVGAGGAVAASRWIESQLFGVRASDPTTYMLVTVLVTIAALAATWQPTRRATRIDPVITLRAE